MPKKAKELGPLAVSRLTQPGVWAVGGVAGLQLQVTPGGSRSWLLRVKVGEKRREMGLGGFPDVSLASAREKARAARTEISQGRDPISDRQAAVSQLLSEQQSALTFKRAAKDYVASHAHSWRNAKHEQQWTSTLETYAFPILGNMLTRDIQPEHVRDVLLPIWGTKTETARRLRSRIELVLEFAGALNAHNGPNPARWKGNLSAVLPKASKISKVKHHEAVHYTKAPAFLASLRDMPGIAPKALEFAILTASRSGEVRGACWSEVDEEKHVWTVPASRMKAGKEHAVPLSNAARRLLKHLPRTSELLFPSAAGKQLSDMTLLAVMKRMGSTAVPHGFRSTFRDWALEKTNHPREICEMALAHTVGGAVENAYKRGEAIQKRARLLNDWAKYVSPQKLGV
ncbi:MAG: integrase arm-type DNA-binding domain-containing protein [Pseudomonadota bacterium]